MSRSSFVGIACGEIAYDMFREDPAFKPEHMYQYMDDGQIVHICVWEWTDWSDFGYNAEQVDWVTTVTLLLNDHESEDDGSFGYKMIKIDEDYSNYSVEFNPPGEDFEIGLKISLDIPSKAMLVVS